MWMEGNWLLLDLRLLESLIRFHDLPFLVDLGISGISTSDSAVGLAAGSTKEDWSCGVSVIS